MEPLLIQRIKNEKEKTLIIDPKIVYKASINSCRVYLLLENFVS